MPLHQNEDGTWQWGKSGKKYKKKEDAIKQMKAIFANGYIEKHAALDGTHFNSTNYRGSTMTYTDVYRMLKQATLREEDAFHPGYGGKTPFFINDGGSVQPRTYLAQPIGKFRRRPGGPLEYKKPGNPQFTPTTTADINTVKANIKRLGKAKGPGDFLFFPNYGD